MSEGSVAAKLGEFISGELLGNRPVNGDDNLLAAGMVSSLGMVRLVAYILDTFGYDVPPEDFTIENFRTINDLDAYLQQALNGEGAAADAP